MPKTIKNDVYVRNLDEYAGTHWIALYVKNNEVVYFDGFGVEHVIGHKSIKTNIQADNSIICGHFCIGFINSMFAGKSLIDFTMIFPYDFKQNDDIILSYFK